MTFVVSQQRKSVSRGRKGQEDAFTFHVRSKVSRRLIACRSQRLIAKVSFTGSSKSSKLKSSGINKEQK